MRTKISSNRNGAREAAPKEQRKEQPNRNWAYYVQGTLAASPGRQLATGITRNGPTSRLGRIHLSNRAQKPEPTRRGT